MNKFIPTVRSFLRDERGATAIEYSLIGVLISITIITGATQLGGAVKSFFEFAATKVAGI